MSFNQNTKSIINDAIVKDIRDAVDDLEYGTVTIIVHNKKITQIEGSDSVTRFATVV